MITVRGLALDTNNRNAGTKIRSAPRYPPSVTSARNPAIQVKVRIATATSGVHPTLGEERLRRPRSSMTRSTVVRTAPPAQTSLGTSRASDENDDATTKAATK